jgi:hypothetical protein
VRVHRHGWGGFTVATVLSVAATSPPARAGDWPQLWGPTVTRLFVRNDEEVVAVDVE